MVAMTNISENKRALSSLSPGENRTRFSSSRKGGQARERVEASHLSLASVFLASFLLPSLPQATSPLLAQITVTKIALAVDRGVRRGSPPSCWSVRHKQRPQGWVRPKRRLLIVPLARIKNSPLLGLIAALLPKEPGTCLSQAPGLAEDGPLGVWPLASATNRDYLPPCLGGISKVCKVAGPPCDMHPSPTQGQREAWCRAVTS